MRTLIGLVLVFAVMAAITLLATGQVQRVPNCSTVTYHGKCL